MLSYNMSAPDGKIGTIYGFCGLAAAFPVTIIIRMTETPPKLVHEDRRAAALRENLLKRKTQLKERRTETNNNYNTETDHVPDAR